MVNFVEAYHFSNTVKESAFICLAFIFFLQYTVLHLITFHCQGGDRSISVFLPSRVASVTSASRCMLVTLPMVENASHVE